MIEKILNYIENHPLVNTILSGLSGIVVKYIYDKNNNKDKLNKLKIKILRDCEDYTSASHTTNQDILRKFAGTIGDFQKRGFISSNLFSNAINNLKKEIEIEVIGRWTIIKRGKEDFDMEKDFTPKIPLIFLQSIEIRFSGSLIYLAKSYTKHKS